VIFSDSRYADGRIYKAHDARDGKYYIGVSRVFPSDESLFYHYTWVINDRIDFIANEFLGSPDLWWKIMDYNPEIINPFYIPVGTIIRIPNG
jgi:hypothetical protein